MAIGAVSHLGKVYGKKTIYQWPEFKKLSKREMAVYFLDFINTGTGIIAKDGAASLSGFMVAGKDGKFYPAEAVIVSNSQVRVSSEQVQAPIDVRYLWVNSANPNSLIERDFLHVLFVPTVIDWKRKVYMSTLNRWYLNWIYSFS